LSTLFLVSVAIVAAATATAVALYFLAHRFQLTRRMEMPPTTMGSVFGLAGTLFSMMVAFAIVDVWGTYDATASIIAAEANALNNIEQMSRSFSVPVRRQVQEAVRNYATLVIEDEWPEMNRGLNRQRTDALLVELWHIFTDMSDEESDHPVYSQSLRNLSDVSTNRRLRHLASTERVPRIMWMLVCCVAVVMFVLSFQFDIKEPRAHALIVGVIAIIVSLAMLLMATLDDPFGGLMALQPEPFQLVLQSLQRLEI
jgi:hypothetical protein